MSMFGTTPQHSLAFSHSQGLGLQNKEQEFGPLLFSLTPNVSAEVQPIKPKTAGLTTHTIVMLELHMSRRSTAKARHAL
jgi:hypothetical protein